VSGEAWGRPPDPPAPRPGESAVLRDHTGVRERAQRDRGHALTGDTRFVGIAELRTETSGRATHSGGPGGELPISASVV
jgi:hypothetical protein